MKITDLQKLLPIGYLYLVILGIAKESILYYQLNINILEYSSLTDILISPISDFTSQPAVLILVALLFFSIYYISKNYDKKWVVKLLKINKWTENLSEEEKRISVQKRLILVLFGYLICIFLGIGLGFGNKIKERIHEETLTYNKEIQFRDGNSKTAYILKSNSAFVLYVEKDSKNISISPLQAVESIEFLRDEEK